MAHKTGQSYRDVTVMDKFGHDMKQIIPDLTVITTHMEQNKKTKP